MNTYLNNERERHSHRKGCRGDLRRRAIAHQQRGGCNWRSKVGLQRMLLCYRYAGVGCCVAVAAVLAAGLQGTGAAGPGGGQLLLLSLPSAAATAGSAARLVVLLRCRRGRGSGRVLLFLLPRVHRGRRRQGEVLLGLGKMGRQSGQLVVLLVAAICCWCAAKGEGGCWGLVLRQTARQGVRQTKGGLCRVPPWGVGRPSRGSRLCNGEKAAVSWEKIRMVIRFRFRFY